MRKYVAVLILSLLATLTGPLSGQAAAQCADQLVTGTATSGGGESYELALRAGTVVRALLYWSDSTADLELRLRGPGGQRVADAAAVGQQQEGLSHQVSTTGTWVLQILNGGGASAGFGLVFACAQPLTEAEPTEHPTATPSPAESTAYSASAGSNSGSVGRSRTAIATPTQLTDAETSADYGSTIEDGSSQGSSGTSVGRATPASQAEVRSPDARPTQPRAPQTTSSSPRTSPRAVASAPASVGSATASEPTVSTPVGGDDGIPGPTTVSELDLWRSRAAAGPYRVPGDAGPNSPGDWERATQQASAFLASPQSALWAGPTGLPGGCLPTDRTGLQDADGNANVPPRVPADGLRDAAFTGLVLGDRQRLDTARATLVAQSHVAATNFQDRTRYCPGVGVLGDDQPLWQISTWALKLWKTHEYLQAAQAISPEESAQVTGWLLAGAKWAAARTDAELNSSSASGGGAGDTANGFAVGQINQLFNNRSGAVAQFYGTVAAHTTDPDLSASAERYFTDGIRFGVYPDGTVSDTRRIEASDAGTGLKYAAEYVGELGLIAAEHARTGDTRLYQFTTSEGANGSEGGTKSLALASLAMAQTVAQTGPGDRVAHTVLAIPNSFYRDPTVAAVASGQAAPFPPNPDRAQNDPWSGPKGVLPGVLFLLG